MNPLKILIVEDNAIIAEDLKELLKDMGYNVVDNVGSYERAKEALATHNVDMVLVDIQLSTQKTGIDLAKHIRVHYNLPFIFITSNSDRTTILEAKETQPNGYLVKPFEEDQLFAAIETATSNFVETSAHKSNLAFSDSIFIKEKNLYHRIKVKELVYLKSENIYVALQTTSNMFMHRESLKHYEELLSSYHFIRVHKSYLVNKDYIQAINSKDILVNGEMLPLSRHMKDKLMDGIRN